MEEVKLLAWGDVHAGMLVDVSLLDRETWVPTIVDRADDEIHLLKKVGESMWKLTIRRGENNAFADATGTPRFRIRKTKLSAIKAARGLPNEED